jgi:hypothetical protein
VEGWSVKPADQAPGSHRSLKTEARSCETSRRWGGDVQGANQDIVKARDSAHRQVGLGRARRSYIPPNSARRATPDEYLFCAKQMRPDVGSGSIASIPRCTRGVRFTPDNGHVPWRLLGLRGVISGDFSHFLTFAYSRTSHAAHTSDIDQLHGPSSPLRYRKKSRSPRSSVSSSSLQASSESWRCSASIFAICGPMLIAAWRLASTVVSRRIEASA